MCPEKRVLESGFLGRCLPGLRQVAKCIYLCFLALSFLRLSFFFDIGYAKWFTHRPKEQIWLRMAVRKHSNMFTRVRERQKVVDRGLVCVNCIHPHIPASSHPRIDTQRSPTPPWAETESNYLRNSPYHGNSKKLVTKCVPIFCL